MGSSLRSLLTTEQQDIFDAVLTLSRREHTGAYLVGGAVRDWLLNYPVGDLDFVVEGDAIALARSLQREFGGAVQSYDKFRTATWISHGLSTDIATAREEVYARPAALPAVTPASIERDLRRRDFTINAMAVRLADNALLDPFAGQADLERGVIRVLHARSFADDPTRLLRAARYAARFDFKLAAETRIWITPGLPFVKDLTGERVRYDLELIFDLPQPERALAMLRQWGVFGAAGIAVPTDQSIGTRFAQARAKLDSKAWNLSALGIPLEDITRAIGWGALIYSLGQMSASRWINWIPFTADLRATLISLGALSTLSAGLFQDKASQQSELLQSFSGLALLLGWLFDSDERKQQAMYAEWHTWRRTQAGTTGDDLRTTGLTPGPQFGKLLARLRNAWLDHEVNSPAEERALLKQLLKQAH